MRKQIRLVLKRKRIKIAIQKIKMIIKKNQNRKMQVLKSKQRNRRWSLKLQKKKKKVYNVRNAIVRYKKMKWKNIWRSSIMRLFNVQTAKFNS